MSCSLLLPRVYPFLGHRQSCQNRHMIPSNEMRTSDDMGTLQHSETTETRKLWENSEYSEPNENGEPSGNSELIETSKDGLSESSESSRQESLVKLVRLAKVATISNLVIQRPCCVSLLVTQHEQKVSKICGNFRSSYRSKIYRGT